MPRLGRVGRGHHLTTPLLKYTDMPLGVCGVGPDHHSPSSSQLYPKKTPRSPSSTPVVIQAVDSLPPQPVSVYTEKAARARVGRGKGKTRVPSDACGPIPLLLKHSG